MGANGTYTIWRTFGGWAGLLVGTKGQTSKPALELRRLQIRFGVSFY